MDSVTDLNTIIETFQSVDPEMRLELLLDFARKLPPLPPELEAERDAGLNRVVECMTPVYLKVTRDDDAMRLHAWVAAEAPTVQGFCGILVRAFDGASPADVSAAPNDLVNRLGLADLIRMNRAVGLGAILARVKKAASNGTS